MQEASKAEQLEMDACNLSKLMQGQEDEIFARGACYPTNTI
jgi:hypothetical protein